MSRYIFEKNYSELNKLLGFYSDLEKSLTLLSGQNSKENEFILEATRLLHNFIASAMSFREHTRRIYKKVCQSQGLLQEYQKKVDVTFTHNDLAQFMECLRAYCQHYQAPVVGSQFIYSKDPPIFTKNMKLNTDALKKFKGWNNEARRYISRHVDGINLLELVHEYYHLIIEFHDWFAKRYVNIIVNIESDF